MPDLHSVLKELLSGASGIGGPWKALENRVGFFDGSSNVWKNIAARPFFVAAFFILQCVMEPFNNRLVYSGCHPEVF